MRGHLVADGEVVRDAAGDQRSADPHVAHFAALAQRTIAEIEPRGEGGAGYSLLDGRAIAEPPTEERHVNRAEVLGQRGADDAVPPVERPASRARARRSRVGRE